MSADPTIVRARNASIRAGERALESLDRDALTPAQQRAVEKIREAFEAMDEDQSEVCATLDLALCGLKQGDREGVKLKGGAWVPRDVIVDQVEVTLKLRKRHGGRS